LFIKEIFRLHGLLDTLVSDRDACFTVHFWDELIRKLGIMSWTHSYHRLSAVLGPTILESWSWSHDSGVTLLRTNVGPHVHGHDLCRTFH